MWKKPVPQTEPHNETEKPIQRATPMQPKPSSASAARIGPSLVVKGELYGEEDLVVDGKVDGSITVKTGGVTVGEHGRVDADIRAASILVAGQVKGNLSGAERVVLMETGRVEGNISAKSVILENGCRFKGSIDMDTSTPPGRSGVDLPRPNGADPVGRAGGLSHGTVRTS